EKLPAWLAIRDEMLAAFKSPDGALGGGLGDKLTKWSQSGDWAFLLEWLETWFRDVAVLGAEAGTARLINADRESDLRATVAKLAPEVAARCHRAVLATRDAVQFNANKPLALEALWLNLQQQGVAA
ncbi:MAG TPA: DNA polymerase III subunit delta' C-terminal domain-containing protein, partial [bacterium]